MTAPAYRQILLPLDGSAASDRAVPYAASFARATGARLALMQCVELHTLAEIDPPAARLHATRQAEDHIYRTALGLVEHGIVADTAIRYGDPVAAILDETSLRGSDLVIMATHGRSSLGRVLFGSVAEAILARSSAPVLLIRSWRPALTAPALPSHPRLLVPLDGSAFAEAALPVAVDLASALHGELVLFQAAPIPYDPLYGRGQRAVLSYHRYGHLVTRQASSYLLRVKWRLLVEAPTLRVSTDARMGPAATIIAAAARVDACDLVVMATHGRTGLSRLVLGSIASRVLRIGTTPLLLVRPGPTLQVPATPVPVDGAAHAGVRGSVEARIPAGV